MSNKENKKIIFIPGWMNEVGIYGGKDGLYDILNVWGDRIGLENEIVADYIVGHSLGCNYALLGWERNNRPKLILVNPLLPKRRIREWFFCWREFNEKEIPPKNKKNVKGIRNIWFGIRMCWKLLRYDFDEILKNISEEDVVIICGEKDVFFCDNKAKEYIRNRKIRMIEVKNVGHDWHEAFNREIKRLVG